MKLLWISDHVGLRYVGQSRVSREICLRLAIQHDVKTIGFLPPQIEEPKEEFSFPIIKTTRGRIEEIDKEIGQWQPDYVVFSHDMFLFSFLPQLRQKYPDVKFIIYATVDGHPFSPTWSAIAYSCDAIMIPSRYGVKTLQNTCPDIPTFYVPYGISSEFYKKTKAAKIQLGPYSIKPPEFVVTYYGANQGKKNIGNALLGWEKFIKDKTDCSFVLVVHTHEIKQDNRTIRHGYNLFLYTYIPQLLILETVATDEQLSTLLSSSDALLFPSIGEGFGLPIVEAMACGCIPITTNFAAPTDFCNKDNSILLDYVPMVGERDTIRAIVSPDEIAKALQYRYELRGTDKEKDMAENCYTTANQFTWAHTVSEINKVFEQIRALPRESYAAKY